MVALRRHIHAHPELGFQEFATSDLVAQRLAEWGYRVTRGVGQTGVVATLQRGPGKSLGIRADMDALPIAETTGLPHASTHSGVMHACGHDGHTAMLLAAARYLARQPNFSGTLHLIFQPAEEGGGGARVMIEDGLFERFPCDAVFAMHNVPGFPAGHLGFASGLHVLGRYGTHHPARPRRPRRGAAEHRRSGGGLRGHRHEPANHRGAQYRSAGNGDRHRGGDAGRPGRQRDPGDRHPDAQRARADGSGA